MFECSLKLLKLAVFEMQFAFEGLSHENLWKRPAPQLLSVGEIAGHIAYWEAVRLAGDGEDLSKCSIQSPLVHNVFRYHTSSVNTEPEEVHLAMTPSEVYQEYLRVHQECLANLERLNPSPDAKIGGDPSGFTYGDFLEYLVFHVSYHTGQMYSVRHLLGDTTPDN